MAWMARGREFISFDEAQAFSGGSAVEWNPRSLQQAREEYNKPRDPSTEMEAFLPAVLRSIFGQFTGRSSVENR